MLARRPLEQHRAGDAADGAAAEREEVGGRRREGQRHPGAAGGAEQHVLERVALAADQVLVRDRHPLAVLVEGDLAVGGIVEAHARPDLDQPGGGDVDGDAGPAEVVVVGLLPGRDGAGVGVGDDRGGVEAVRGGRCVGLRLGRFPLGLLGGGEHRVRLGETTTGDHARPAGDPQRGLGAALGARVGARGGCGLGGGRLSGRVARVDRQADGHAGEDQDQGQEAKSVCHRALHRSVSGKSLVT